MSSLKECIRLLSNERVFPSYEQVFECMHEIMTGKATAAQIGAYLVSLQIQPIPAQVLISSASALRALSRPCPYPRSEGALLLDIVGTGGDSFDTFNASTAASVILAACGVPCAKHGNRSSSGKCGSADLIEALGANLGRTEEQVAKSLEKCGFTFLFAQYFHPSMGSVAPIRKELGIRTIFNMLGPLINPLKPSHMLLGVGVKPLGPLYAEVLSKTEHVERAMIVHSELGLDEIGPSGETFVWEVNGSTITTYTINPSTFGLPEHSVEEVAGSSPSDNAKKFRQILEGEEGPTTDFLLMNCAAAVFLCGKADSLVHGVEVARNAILSGETRGSGSSKRENEHIKTFAMRACSENAKQADTRGRKDRMSEKSEKREKVEKPQKMHKSCGDSAKEGRVNNLKGSDNESKSQSLSLIDSDANAGPNARWLNAGSEKDLKSKEMEDKGNKGGDSAVENGSCGSRSEMTDGSHGDSSKEWEDEPQEKVQEKEKDKGSEESESETTTSTNIESSEDKYKTPETKGGDKKNGGGFFSMFKRSKAGNFSPDKQDKDKHPHKDKYTRQKEKEREKRRANKKHYAAGNVSELPSDIQKKIAAAKLSPEELEASFEALLFVLRFVTKDSYRLPNAPSPPHSERTPYASPELTNKAKIISILSDKEIKKKFKRMELSGKGGFGRVFQTKDAVTKQQIAVKRLPHYTKKQKQNNYCEVAFLMGCTNHPNIVNFYEAYQINEEVWIVTEFLEGGTLDLAIKVHRFHEQHIVYVAGEILKGVQYLHSLNYVHRDLKSSNVMMSIVGEIKIIDFGLCCDLHKGPRQQTLGSPYWMPPEMVMRKPHDTKADIWSYAILIAEMILSRPPYYQSRMVALWYACTGKTIECIEEVFASKSKDRLQKTYSQDMLDFMRLALVADPKMRPTASDLLQHKFLNKYPDPREGIDGILRTIFISSNLQLHGI